MLGVAETTLQQYGAVSEETALEMVKGAQRESDCQVAVSVTGIAGPGGGSEQKPVGMVCFGFKIPAETRTTTQYFEGSRDQIRQASLQFVLDQLLEKL